jgi:pimeloyl-ACP methyl ester carboxylesterase
MVDFWGPRDGFPVFLLHGTPGSRLGPRPGTNELHLSGIRLIAYDRPGYGGSDRLEGRQVDHAAKDVEAIARHLGLAEFSVVGRSGGAPHALACAARMPGTVRSVAILACLAPPDTQELPWSDGTWFDGMTQSNIDAFSMARRHPDWLREVLLERRSNINDDPEQIIVDLGAELSLSDRRIVMETNVRNMLIDNFSAAFDPTHDRGRKQSRPGPQSDRGYSAFASGRDGWFDDVLSFTHPWGFEVSDITVPTLVWHGELDRFSPINHFHWLAEHIEDAKAVIEPDSRYFGAVHALPRVLRWLVSTASASGSVRGAADRAPGRCGAIQ